MSSLETYQAQLVNDALTAGALKFGSFTLKSGRCVFAWDRSLNTPHIDLNRV